MRYILKNRNLLLLFIASGLFFLNEMMLMPTLPLYLSALGYSNLALGSVLGSFALGVLVLRPIAGLVTDRKSRKLSLLIGLAVFIIAPPLYLLSDSFAYLLCVRFFHGIGITFFTTASPTLVTDIAPSRHRGEVLGHMSIASIFSMALGPIVGVTLFTNFGMPLLLAGCSLMGLGGLVLIFFIREPHRSPTEQTTITYKQAIFTRIVIVSSVVLFIEAQIYGGFFTFLPLLLESVGNQRVGLFFMVASGTMIIGRFSIAHFADVYGRGPMFFYSFLIIIASVVLIAQVNSLTMLIAAALLYGVGSTICMPALIALVADSSDPEARGRVFSFFYGAFDVGVISAGVFLGFWADLFGLRGMFMLAAGLGLVAALFFMLTIQSKVGRSMRWTLTGE
ncbi:MAG: MFS transporter [Deltaproteobacteria bacterium]|nr:MFS transporter [Deltaproteobacteria bacterium]